MIPDKNYAEDLPKTLVDWAGTFGTTNYEPALHATLPDLHEGFTRNFDVAMDSQGVPWKDRVNDPLPWPLLIKSGKMFRAATQVGSTGALYQNSGDELLRGVDDSAVPYAKFHVSGTRKMPARDFMYQEDKYVEQASESFFEVAYEMLVNE